MRKRTGANSLVQTGFQVKINIILLDESVHIAQNLLNDFGPGGDSPLDLAFQITQQQAAEEWVLQHWLPNDSAAEQAGAKVCSDDFAQLLACHCNAQQLPRCRAVEYWATKFSNSAFSPWKPKRHDKTLWSLRHTAAPCAWGCGSGQFQKQASPAV